jgi:hypothetical protein
MLKIVVVVVHSNRINSRNGLTSPYSGSFIPFAYEIPILRLKHLINPVVVLPIQIIAMR